MRSLVPFLGLLLLPSVAFATTNAFTANGAWTAPAGVTTVQVRAWAGGGGAADTNGGGGGGGAYSGLNSFVVTPGNVYNVVVGAGGIAAPASGVAGTGGDSMFSASSTLLAKGGGPGIKNAGGLGAGGAAASGVGDVKHSGAGASNGSNICGGGGGGGGAAGTTADGTSGNTCGDGGSGGAGGAVGGGNGGQADTNSPAAQAPGGGAGGRSGTAGGFAGARGEVDITYTLPSPPESYTCFFQ